MAEEGWTVVGGPGKGGKPRDGQPPAEAASRHAEELQERQPESDSLPGWEAPPAAAPAAGRRQRQRRGFRERTREQKIADHCETIADCKREVSRHLVFASLQRAVARAAGAIAPQEQEPAAALPGVQQLVIYGLGCVEDSLVSRYQLALALLLRDLLPGLAAEPELFDPAFSDVDRGIMSNLQLNPIEVDESGARSVSTPTCFYLPHLEVSRRAASRLQHHEPLRLPGAA
jgi:hypothetical protein